MQDLILWCIIIAILGSAIGYIINQKRKGVKCVGCGSEAKCSSCPPNSHESSCGCSEQSTPSCQCTSKESN